MAPTRIALVTGSTRGIGLAIARRLAQEGYCLALNYLHNESQAENALAEIRPHCPSAVVLRGDMGHPEESARVIQTLQETFGRLDLLVNNVGPFVPKGLAETSVAEWELMVNGVLGSVFHTLRHTLPLMRAQSSGTIITIGSLNGELARGAPTTALYNALKTATIVLTRSVARSEGPYGIRANVVNPGIVDAVGVDPATIVEQIPLRRLGHGDEIAKAVAWLASDEAAYVNGAVLNIHGGLWA